MRIQNGKDLPLGNVVTFLDIELANYRWRAGGPCYLDNAAIRFNTTEGRNQTVFGLGITSVKKDE